VVGSNPVRGQRDGSGNLNMVCLYCQRNEIYPEFLADVMFKNYHKMTEIPDWGRETFTGAVLQSIRDGVVGDGGYQKPASRKYSIPPKRDIDAVFYPEQKKDFWSKVKTWIIKQLQ